MTFRRKTTSNSGIRGSGSFRFTRMNRIACRRDLAADRSRLAPHAPARNTSGDCPRSRRAVRRIDAGLGLLEDDLVDVRGEHLEWRASAVLRRPAEVLRQRHRQRVRLFARRAGRAPDAERRPIGRAPLGQNALRKELEVLGLPEEVRLVVMRPIVVVLSRRPSLTSCRVVEVVLVALNPWWRRRFIRRPYERLPARARPPRPVA
jgi:hypothetical protein